MSKKRKHRDHFTDIVSAVKAEHDELDGYYRELAGFGRSVHAINYRRRSVALNSVTLDAVARTLCYAVRAVSGLGDEWYDKVVQDLAEEEGDDFEEEVNTSYLAGCDTGYQSALSILIGAALAAVDVAEVRKVDWDQQLRKESK